MLCWWMSIDYKTPVDLSGFLSAYEDNFISDLQQTSLHLGFTEIRYPNDGVYDI